MSVMDIAGLTLAFMSLAVSLWVHYAVRKEQRRNEK